LVCSHIDEGARAAARVQLVLLPAIRASTLLSSARHAQQKLLQQGQLPLLCSIIKAYPAMTPVQWVFPIKPELPCAHDDALPALESAMNTERSGEDVANACLQLKDLIRCSSSSSSSKRSSSGLYDSLSMLLLLARWLRVRALQMQSICQDMQQMNARCDDDDWSELQYKDQLHLEGFNISRRNLHAAAKGLEVALHCVVRNISSVISRHLAVQQQPYCGSSSNSSTTTGSTREGSNSSAALAAMQQLHERLQHMHSHACCVCTVLCHSSLVPRSIVRRQPDGGTSTPAGPQQFWQQR
jgi:hypothetical protein